jgi:hypothetical protein
MKKNILITALFFVSVCLWAQSGPSGRVLPGYNGYWTRQERITIFNLVRFYPERLPFLRNEIYARYGRPFVNPVYQDYFKRQSWYRVQNNYTDDWLSAIDKYNAEFILSVEQPALGFADTVKMLIQNGEYQGEGVVLTFVSKQELLAGNERDPYDFYGSGISVERYPWVVMGDWVIVYRASVGQDYMASAYKLDHNRRRIIAGAHTTISASSLDVLIEAQKNR